MKILFDQGTPVPLRRYLRPHMIDTTAERGWSTVTNGELLNLAEQEGYAVVVTTDQNLRYQQNLIERKLGIVVLMSASWPGFSELLPRSSRRSHESLAADTKKS